MPHHRTKCLILYLNYLLLSVGLDFYFYITSACNIAIIAFRFDVSFIASWNIPSALVWKPGTLTIFGRTYFDFLHFFYCSSDFALRSYLYLFIHALVAGPASLIFGEHKVCNLLLFFSQPYICWLIHYSTFCYWWHFTYLLWLYRSVCSTQWESFLVLFQL